MTYQLIALPARTDNYIWLIRNATHAWVIDPAQAEPVQHYIAQNRLILADLLITHHHNDHTHGIAALTPLVQGRIIGASERIPGLTHRIKTEHTITLSFSTLTTRILHTPGHTYDHICYHIPHLLQTGVLFSGDTLFSAGCGRVFDGTLDQLYQSLEHIMTLPANTHIACAHEYTQANLDFALAIDPTHLPTQQHANQVKYLINQGQPSLPSTLATEQRINPYLRILNMRNRTQDPKEESMQWQNQLLKLSQTQLNQMPASAAQQQLAQCIHELTHAQPHTHNRALFALCRTLKNHF